MKSPRYIINRTVTSVFSECVSVSLGCVGLDWTGSSWTELDRDEAWTTRRETKGDDDGEEGREGGEGGDREGGESGRDDDDDR